MSPQQFVIALQSLRFKNTFNPYVNRCSVHDLADAPAQRRNALLSILESAVMKDVDSIWIGRDLGYRGGRRTGLALTDDVHIDAHAKRWGLNISRPTHGKIVAERTAAVVWDVLSQIEKPVFLWNVFPLHPFEEDDPFSNRTHNASERKAGEEVLASLINLLRPRRLIAIGNDAAASARRIASGHEVFQVRHPSYGGQNEFLRSMRILFSLTNNPLQPRLF